MDCYHWPLPKAKLILHQSSFAVNESRSNSKTQHSSMHEDDDSRDVEDDVVVTRPPGDKSLSTARRHQSTWSRCIYEHPLNQTVQLFLPIPTQYEEQEDSSHDIEAMEREKQTRQMLRHLQPEFFLKTHQHSSTSTSTSSSSSSSPSITTTISHSTPFYYQGVISLSDLLFKSSQFREQYLLSGCFHALSIKTYILQHNVCSIITMPKLKTNAQHNKNNNNNKSTKKVKDSQKPALPVPSSTSSNHSSFSTYLILCVDDDTYQTLGLEGGHHVLAKYEKYHLIYYELNQELFRTKNTHSNTLHSTSTTHQETTTECSFDPNHSKLYNRLKWALAKLPPLEMRISFKNLQNQTEYDEIDFASLLSNTQMKKISMQADVFNFGKPIAVPDLTFLTQLIKTPASASSSSSSSSSPSSLSLSNVLDPVSAECWLDVLNYLAYISFRNESLLYTLQSYLWKLKEMQEKDDYLELENNKRRKLGLDEQTATSSKKGGRYHKIGSSNSLTTLSSKNLESWLDVQSVVPFTDLTLLQRLEYWLLRRKEEVKEAVTDSHLHQTIDDADGNIRFVNASKDAKNPTTASVSTTNSSTVLSAHAHKSFARTFTWKGMIDSSDIDHMVQQARRLMSEHALPWISLTVHGYADAPWSWRNKEHGCFNQNGDNNYCIFILPNDQYAITMMLGEQDAIY